ncbi:multicopper oxidase type 2 [Leptothrix cholodnii SP-6]|uniref:Multicopper oxidase type 2 n=1 Tax=Leptothrix cholodnii (strain ATCC 51168 / LMG 8142 / SP-6) TaxID=395495 RepID=B1Y7A1_LEPCP|nr:multicopper oxidase domain-containing protein [Leptothrix cholodnii]ACB34856.1 multicopper oxidase type 2 [Leptothrix cholodnii SP-6]
MAVAQSTGSLDFFGDPPATDPSAYVEPKIGADGEAYLLAQANPANHGAFDGGLTGTHVDPQAQTSVPQAEMTSANVPTNSKPSPLMGARMFDTPMLMFEEFGTDRLDPSVAAPTQPFPRPKIGAAPESDPVSVARSAPDGVELDSFLAQRGIAPYPTRESNTLDQNPWAAEVADFLDRQLTGAPAEGRPPGEGWAHQRWNEFSPQVFYKTAQTGARLNRGLRDSRQLHGFRVGEWAPGGLYHRFGTNSGTKVQFHPGLPVQNHNAVWTFDGTMPPKLLMARYGQPLLMRHYNALPIDPAANKGFGLHTITTHEHNGHNPAESDGFANAFFFPGQFYDYRWPMQLAGYDTINTTATDDRAAFPCSTGETLYVNDLSPGLKTCQNGRIRVRGDWRETMSTHWFHDHMLDFTAQNVYKGNAAMMNYYSALDRGNEVLNDGINLRLPSGSALPWGNRDYDVNLLLADKAWDKEGQLWFNVFNKDGFIGDRILTNWTYYPYLDVRARRYRFRILNGSVSRYFMVALVQQVSGTAGEFQGPAGSNVSYNRVPFHMVANDGNLLEHAVAFDGKVDLDRNGNKAEHKGMLPIQGIAERYDIVVDFASFAAGSKLYFVNVLEHTKGEVTGSKISLARILSESYKPLARDKDGDRVADRWENGDPGVGRFMELRVHPSSGTDKSMNPANFVAGKKKMIPLTLDRDSAADYAKLSQARHRTFEFGRSGGTDAQPWTIRTDHDLAVGADPRRTSAAPQLTQGPTPAGFAGNGTLEVWKLDLGGGWSHPIHIHFEEGIVLRRGGKAPPDWEKWARKDVFRLGPDSESGDSVEVALRFREFAGTFVEHCHNTQHEDSSMLLRWDVERPGQVLAMPTPMPTWEGVDYVGQAALPTFRTGDGTGPSYAFGR